MARQPQSIKNNPEAQDHLGITFDEIHSDEPHESIDGKRAEVSQPYSFKKDSHLTDHDNVFDVTKAYTSKREETGIFVSDKRRTTPTFSSGITSVLSEWWSGTKHSLGKLTGPVPKKKTEVPAPILKAETRAAIIQAAIKPSGIAPKDDHHVIIEKFRTFKQDVARATGTPIIVKERVEDKNEWVHVIEDPKEKKSATPTQDDAQKIIPSNPQSKTVTSASTSIDLLPSPPDLKKLISLTKEDLDTKINTERRATPAHIIAPETTAQNKILEQSTMVSIAPAVTHSTTREESQSALTEIVESIEEKGVTKAVTHLPRERQRVTSQPAFQKQVSQPTIAPAVAPIPTFEVPEKPETKQPVLAEAVIEKQILKPSIAPSVAQLPAIEKITPVPLQNKLGEIFTRDIPPMSKAAELPPQARAVPVSHIVLEPLPKIPTREIGEVPVKHKSEAVELSTISSEDVLEATFNPELAPRFHRTGTVPKQVHEVQKDDDSPAAMEIASGTSVQGRGALPIRSILLYVLLAGVILLGVVLAVIASVSFNTTPETNPGTIPATMNVPHFFLPDFKTPLSLTPVHETFLKDLRVHIDQAGVGVTQLYPTIQDGMTSRPGTAEEVLTTLSITLNNKTRQALSDTIMIGSITTTKNEPFIILQSYNFDVLFSGMLAWEKSLYTDVMPLFGSLKINDGRFTDAIQNNKPVRILVDGTGAEIFLYSFIDQNTVIITTSKAALSKLSEKF